MTSKISIGEIVGGGYGEFWRTHKRYRVVKGSRASKKSKTTALNIIFRMMQYPLANTLVIRNTLNSLKDSCWSDLQWATYRLQVNHLWEFTKSPLEARYKPTGQMIFFRGMDDPQRIASITVPKGYLCWAWLEECFEIESEADFDMIDESIRGTFEENPEYFKQITLTFNPWSESSWLKARFFDEPDDDTFAITTTYKCNEWLDEADKRLFEKMKEQNPTRYRVAGEGEWGIDGQAVFEEWQNLPEHYKDRVGTHVIDPFEIPKDWKIYRGFDFGYAKPFSVGWYAVDYDGRLYHILELYGCTKEPNTGVKWTPDRIFKEIKRIEEEHRWLKGKHIYGIADPSIWDASRGKSVNDSAMENGVYFDPGDNKRIPGLMQCHYRLEFDENGIPMFYCFNTCKNFIRTVPALKYDELHVEDVDTDMEDHVYDSFRYVCMSRPVKPSASVEPKNKVYNPLDTDDSSYSKYDFYRLYN